MNTGERELEDAAAPVKRTIKSYVVRAGRMTGGQQEAYDTLFPVYGLNQDDGVLDQQRVFGRVAPLVFEIGFGMGQSLIDMAKAAPDLNFIGVEVHPPGIGNLLRGIYDEKLQNLRVYRGDARDILARCIADQSLTTLQIFFPDPWHKKRHNKRRLIQPEFIASIAPKLCSGGHLHLATDWEEYAIQMMEVMSAAQGFANANGSGRYATDHNRPETKFERRGQRLGHGVWDLVFSRL